MELEQRLSNLVEAMTDSTRGAILVELGDAGERTATQLAHRLDLTANNVYHHMRVLRRLEVVPAPRAVPGPTYVEKYYRLHPDLAQAVHDPFWLDHVLDSQPPAVLRRLMAAELLLLSHLLRRASARVDALGDDAILQQRLDARSMVSFGRMSDISYAQRLARMRAIVQAEAEEAEGGTAPPESGGHLVLMVGMPDLWEGPPAR